MKETKALGTTTEGFERSIRKSRYEKYVLRLYVTGMSPRSLNAIENIRRICKENLEGRYELEIIDIYQKPGYARKDEIIAAPTLVKKLPLPLRKFIGDLSNRERILVGLDLAPRM
ncbi:MAG: circadian clock KaiB family protein [archaeon]|nr:circadian clock KaiB family protein [archaeon]